jgi:hypothetical protein
MTAEELDGQLDLLHVLSEQSCTTCEQISRGAGSSCGQHRRGAMYEWHTCDVCSRRFKGHNGFKDGFGVVGYGVNWVVARAAYCCGEHMSGASQIARERYAELTNTTQED